MPAFCAAKRRTLGKEKLKGGKGERKKEGERFWAQFTLSAMVIPMN